MTDSNLFDQTKEDRKKFKELRVLAMQLLEEKVRPEERSTLIRAAADDLGRLEELELLPRDEPIGVVVEALKDQVEQLL